MLKVGITERGDAGLDLSWGDKLSEVDASIVITKQLTEGCKVLLLKNSSKCILHATITGYGGTVLEPNVPCWQDELARVHKLIQKDGFPISQVVIRVDPIIPTKKGIRQAFEVLNQASVYGFKRFRVSVIDMYQHVRERFKNAGLPLPYLDGFAPTKPMLDAVDAMLRNFRTICPDASIESCAERLEWATPIGCVSMQDMALLGIEHGELNDLGAQRSGCLCYSGKTELLTNRHRCAHQCLYCYWKD